MYICLTEIVLNGLLCYDRNYGYVSSTIICGVKYPLLLILTLFVLNIFIINYL